MAGSTESNKTEWPLLVDNMLVGIEVEKEEDNE